VAVDLRLVPEDGAQRGDALGPPYLSD